LLGRRREREVVERLLHDARSRRVGPVREPGRRQDGVAGLRRRGGAGLSGRALGVEGEMELAYAAPQQLCSPSLELLERLPDPQRDAIAMALGLGTGQAPSTFLVGLAVLGLLSEAADERPLL
jgi:hypothetical protein